VKRLFAIVIVAAVLSCAGVGVALAWRDDLEETVVFESERTLSADDGRYDGASATGGTQAPIVFSSESDDWIAVIVRQDSVQSVLVRLYGRIIAEFVPSDVFADVSGIDGARVWIGDSNGNPLKRGVSGEAYVIIEGAAPSEAAAKEATINWIGCDSGDLSLIQDFSDNPILVADMASGEPIGGKSAGGCDASFGGFIPVAILACFILAREKRANANSSHGHATS
jgi:hypothetical protein